MSKQDYIFPARADKHFLHLTNHAVLPYFARAGAVSQP